MKLWKYLTNHKINRIVFLPAAPSPLLSLAPSFPYDVTLLREKLVMCTQWTRSKGANSNLFLITSKESLKFFALSHSHSSRYVMWRMSHYFTPCYACNHLCREVSRHDPCPFLWADGVADGLVGPLAPAMERSRLKFTSKLHINLVNLLVRKTKVEKGAQ